MTREEMRENIIKGIMNGDVEVINCTPHPLTWVREDGVVTIAPSGTEARIDTKEVELGNGFVTSERGEVIDLPEHQEGKVFVVSGYVFAATEERLDVLAPNTNRSIRNENGQIIGVPGFIMH